jgi:hypothetical protein
VFNGQTRWFPARAVWRKIAGAPCSHRDYCLSIDESLANYAKMTAFDRETFEARVGRGGHTHRTQSIP